MRLGIEVGQFDCRDQLGGSKVMDCQFWGNGVALMSVDLRIVCASLDRKDNLRAPHVALLERSPIHDPAAVLDSDPA